MKCAVREEMHPLFFGFKRVHHRLLVASRELLAGVGLTPARFDLLRVVDAHRGGVAQAKVIVLLGVSAATVSRMITSLEKIGLLARERGSYRDGRLVHLRLTDAGRRTLRRALYRAIGGGAADLLAASALTQRWWAPEGEHGQLADVLDMARTKLGDRAPFRHPWSDQDLWSHLWPPLSEVMPEFREIFRRYEARSP
jgi:DNA-binding MarR family transcriptional regulator